MVRDQRGARPPLLPACGFRRPRRYRFEAEDGIGGRSLPSLPAALCRLVMLADLPVTRATTIPPTWVGQAPAEPTGEVIEPLSLGEQVAPGVEAARTEQQQAWCRHLAAGGSWWAAPEQTHADAQTRGDCQRLSLLGKGANPTGCEPEERAGCRRARLACGFASSARSSVGPIPTPPALLATLGFPRFRGHRSGVHRCECTSCNELLLVVDRAEVTDR